MPEPTNPTDQLLSRLLSRLKMRHLMLLLHIRRFGSLTRVAQELATTQSAVTQTLAELEGMFGVPLFVRTGRGMRATPLGEIALARAELMMQDLEHWAREMESVEAGFAAHLHVGVIPFVSGKLICDAILHTHGKGGKLAVTIREATSDQLLRALHEHELDCVIARATAAACIPGIVHEVLYHQSPRLITNPRLAGHLAALPLDWAKLARLDWILPSPSTPIGAMVNDLFIRSGVRPPSPLIETYSLKILGHMIQSSAAVVSIVPADIADELERTEGVASVPYRLDWQLPPIALFRRQRDMPLKVEDMFAQALRELCMQFNGVLGNRVKPSQE
ncbi:MAG: LysR family transcriptional regulator [Pseudomonadota bacterium]